ncbi:uncharacterized protein LOC141656863 [Silene latifolia]|uniref:uncharacterized protein LOC141656863 n=1 Tax=Silene latifolia TaxID=37657 RepID=UPI003D7870BA
MENTEAEQIQIALNSAISQIKWRLKPSSKRRLEIDVLALCSRMRPVVMVDYGGKMPELQDRLCSLIELLHKESTFFKQLRVMVIEDMIYLVNISEFAEYVTWSLSSDAKQFFVDLEHDPPEMILADAQTLAVKELVSVYHLFSSVFTRDGVNENAIQGQSEDLLKHAESSSHDKISEFSEVLDLSSCLQDYQITIPTLNGWLLGYPVIYLFGKDHISDAIYNLSTKPLHLFRVLFRRNPSHTNPSPLEELMSFSVPYDLSINGRNEPWAEAFWLQMQAKQERCKQVWRSLQMEVGECYPQAIAL